MNERQQIELLKAEYLSAGYEVSVGARMHGMMFDLVAENREETVFVEVIGGALHRRSREIIARAKRMSGVLRDVPNSRVEFRFLDTSVDTTVRQYKPRSTSDALNEMNRVAHELFPLPKRITSLFDASKKYDELGYWVLWRAIAQGIRAWASHLDEGHADDDRISNDDLQSIYLLILQDRNDSLDANEFSDVQEAQALEFNEVRNTCLRLLDGSLGKVEIRDFIQLEGVTRIVASALRDLL